MAATTSTGYRFATVTPNDHSGLIYIATFLAFTYSNITFLARCFIKWQVFGVDDLLTCLAQVATLVQFALLLVSLSAGLGKNFDTIHKDNYVRMASSQYGNQIAFFIALGLSKCAAVMLIQRLFTRDTKKSGIIYSIIMGLVILWTILAACLVSVGCSPESIAPLREVQICAGVFIRYRVVVITDTVTDVLLVLVPAYLVWQLQMSVQLKLQVISVFAFRLPLLPLSILALQNWNKSLHSINPGVDRAYPIIYQQSQLCFSLIAGTVPCLKSFIRSFDTGSGVKVGYTSNAYGSGGYGKGESYRMRSLNTNGSTLKTQNGEDGDIKIDTRHFNPGHEHRRGRGNSTTMITTLASSSKKATEEDTASHGSQELFIRRDVQWEVRTENL